MTINSRQKGASGEREAAKAIAAVVGLDIKRSARNGVQGADDVIGWPGVHMEIKRRSKIAALRLLDQSIQDAGSDLPIVVMREDRGKWVLMVELKDLPRLCGQYATAQGVPTYPGDH